MTRSSSMTSCPVLRCLAPRLPVLSVGFGSVLCSMPLGRIVGRPVTPLSLTISARKSATTCFSAAFSASRRSVRASRSPRDSSERGIFSGTDMPGTNGVRYEQVQPRSSSYLPGFLPQVRVVGEVNGYPNTGQNSSGVDTTTPDERVLLFMRQLGHHWHLGSRPPGSRQVSSPEGGDSGRAHCRSYLPHVRLARPQRPRSRYRAYYASVCRRSSLPRGYHRPRA